MTELGAVRTNEKKLSVLRASTAKRKMHGRPQNFFPEGAKPPNLQKVDTFSAPRTQHRPFFGEPEAQTKIFAFFRVF